MEQEVRNRGSDSNYSCIVACSDIQGPAVGCLLPCCWARARLMLFRNQCMHASHVGGSRAGASSDTGARCTSDSAPAQVSLYLLFCPAVLSMRAHPCHGPGTALPGGTEPSQAAAVPECHSLQLAHWRHNRSGVGCCHVSELLCYGAAVRQHRWRCLVGETSSDCPSHNSNMRQADA